MMKDMKTQIQEYEQVQSTMKNTHNQTAEHKDKDNIVEVSTGKNQRIESPHPSNTNRHEKAAE